MKDVPGIINPFAPKQKKKPNISDLDKRLPESGIIIEPAITLDGDSYILKFDGITDVTQAVARLTNLLDDVNKIHGDELIKNGIVVSRGNTRVPEKDEMSLEGPQCTIIVFVGNPPHVEIDAYRRIAFTLKKLPIRQILTKYRATVSERG